MTLTCGVDVGGTKIAAGVVDEDGNVLAESRVDSPAGDGVGILDAIERLVRDFTVDHEITAVGIGAAGYVDHTRSVVMFAPNLAWEQMSLRADLETRLGLPIVIENDANAAAWGEFAFGAGRDVEDLLMVTVGTGVGGGIVLNGRLHRGAFGVGAEVGHLRVEPGGRPCGCGNLGCWEQYASGSALVAQVRDSARSAPDAAGLIQRAGGQVDAITGPMVTEAALDGDAFACAALAELGRWLGEGIASLVAVLDPAAVVIGGGVGAAGDLLITPTRTAYEAEVTGRGHRPFAEILPALLGNSAGMVGAADLARR